MQANAWPPLVSIAAIRRYHSYMYNESWEPGFGELVTFARHMVEQFPFHTVNAEANTQH